MSSSRLRLVAALTSLMLLAVSPAGHTAPTSSVTRSDAHTAYQRMSHADTVARHARQAADAAKQQRDTAAAALVDAVTRADQASHDAADLAATVRRTTATEVAATRAALDASARMRRTARAVWMSTGSTAGGFITTLTGGSSRADVDAAAVVDRLATTALTRYQQALTQAAAATAATRAALDRYHTAADHAARLLADAEQAANTAAKAAATFRAARHAAATADKAAADASSVYRRIATTVQQQCRRRAAVNGDNAGYVWASLVRHGFSEAAAAGVLGNLQQESNVDPTAVQNGGPGRGLAQWSVGGRWDTSPLNVVDFARSRHRSPWDLRVQVDFIVTEMQQIGYDLATFKAMTDPVAAAVYFHDNYEMSADSSGFVVSVRGGNAQAFYSRFHANPPAAADCPLPR